MHWRTTADSICRHVSAEREEYDEQCVTTTSLEAAQRRAAL